MPPKLTSIDPAPGRIFSLTALGVAPVVVLRSMGLGPRD